MLSWMARSCTAEWFPEHKLDEKVCKTECVDLKTAQGQNLCEKEWSLASKDKLCKKTCSDGALMNKMNACFFSQVRSGQGRAAEDFSFKKNGGEQGIPWHVAPELTTTFQKEFDDLYNTKIGGRFLYKEIFSLYTTEERVKRLEEILGDPIVEEVDESKEQGQGAASQLAFLFAMQKNKEMEKRAAELLTDARGEKRRMTDLKCVPLSEPGFDLNKRPIARELYPEREAINRTEKFELGMMRRKLEAHVDNGFYKNQEPIAIRWAADSLAVVPQYKGYHPYNLHSSYTVEFKHLQDFFNQLMSDSRAFPAGNMLDVKIRKILDNLSWMTQPPPDQAKDLNLSAECKSNLSCAGIANLVEAIKFFYLKVDFGNGLNRIARNLSNPNEQRIADECLVGLRKPYLMTLTPAQLRGEIAEIEKNPAAVSALTAKYDKDQTDYFKNVAMCDTVPLQPLSKFDRTTLISVAFAKMFYRIVLEREGLWERKKMILNQLPERTNLPAVDPDEHLKTAQPEELIALPNGLGCYAKDDPEKKVRPCVKTDIRQINPVTALPGANTRHELRRIREE
ncbi:MAG: hypothetical protein ABL958_21360, partial [Bdellovibrionia bacterium]